MKNLIYLLTILTLFLTACGPDDSLTDEYSQYKNNLGRSIELYIYDTHELSITFRQDFDTIDTQVLPVEGVHLYPDTFYINLPYGNNITLYGVGYTGHIAQGMYRIYDEEGKVLKYDRLPQSHTLSSSMPLKCNIQFVHL